MKRSFLAATLNSLKTCKFQIYLIIQSKRSKNASKCVEALTSAIMDKERLRRMKCRKNVECLNLSSEAYTKGFGVDL